MFHQVLAEIPLVSYCKVFTNKRDLLFFIHFILRGIPLAFFLSKLFLPGVVYNVQVLIFSLQPLSWHFACLRHIINELLSSLPEHCQCFPREDVSPIFSLGSVREIHSLGKYFSVHSLGHSEYQETHTFSVVNIDSAKIDTSLLMMRECVVFYFNPIHYTPILHAQCVQWCVRIVVHCFDAHCIDSHMFIGANTLNFTPSW